MDLESLSLRSGPSGVAILDQTRLPREEVWLDGSDPAAMIAHIQALRVRGAPAIGVAAALCLARYARDHGTADVLAAADALADARPTAVNLRWAMDRLRSVILAGGDTQGEAEGIFLEDVATCAAMAGHGAALLRDGDHVLTHCNTGGLATAGVGTALGAIRRAHEDGKHLHVWVGETRPLRQGARLTTWEIGRLGIPHTLVTDSMAGALLATGRIAHVLVGADRIARNGDFANKVGTYGLAVLAHAHGVPFHVVAPRSTLDPDLPDGAGIPIEERDPDEVTGRDGEVPEGTHAWNPAFDVTPARLVTSFVLETGVGKPPFL